MCFVSFFASVKQALAFADKQPVWSWLKCLLSPPHQDPLPFKKRTTESWVFPSLLQFLGSHHHMGKSITVTKITHSPPTKSSLSPTKQQLQEEPTCEQSQILPDQALVLGVGLGVYRHVETQMRRSTWLEEDKLRTKASFRGAGSVGSHLSEWPHTWCQLPSSLEISYNCPSIWICEAWCRETATHRSLERIRVACRSSLLSQIQGLHSQPTTTTAPSASSRAWALAQTQGTHSWAPGHVALASQSDYSYPQPRSHRGAVGSPSGPTPSRYLFVSRSGGGKRGRDTERKRKKWQGPACLFKKAVRKSRNGMSLSLKGTSCPCPSRYLPPIKIPPTGFNSYKSPPTMDCDHWTQEKEADSPFSFPHPHRHS